MIRKYGLGLGKLPFIFAKEYLDINLINEGIVSTEEVEPNVSVDVEQYVDNNELTIRLIGNDSVAIKYLELEGERRDIARTIIHMRQNKVRVSLIE